MSWCPSSAVEWIVSDHTGPLARLSSAAMGCKLRTLQTTATTMEAKPLSASNTANPVSKSPKEGKTGRPTVMTPEVMDLICARTADGESMRALGRDPDMPSKTTIQRALYKDSAFASRYAVARESMYKGWAEEIVEISDDGTTDYITKVGRNGHEYEAVDQEHIQRSRLRVDTRKWLLSKLLPNTYGDKVEHQHGGEVAHTVTHTLDDREKMRRMALFMLEDQAAGVTFEGTSHTVPEAGQMPGTVTKSQASKSKKPAGKPLSADAASITQGKDSP